MSSSLSRLEVFVLDCQSTGASPAHGHVLEVAWCRTDGRREAEDRPARVENHLVALPHGERVPRRISRLTGIRDADLEGAAGSAEVWASLCADARAAGESPVPAVAHFARFERAFLSTLHEQHGDGGFPFEWICTHEIARRLLPGLPRRGLRAVSGYFGRVMGEGKRAADHVRASRGVWVELVERLDADHGVNSLPALRAWLASTEPARVGGRDYSVAREKRLVLPEAPGVYRMLGRRGQVLYVGKATSLRRRVNSYFQKRRHESERTPEMLTQAFDLDVTETATALEAALLESDEIKRCAPPYNVSLRGRQGDVVYLANDLSGTAPGVDRCHRLGPLPGSGAIDSWVALAALLAGAGSADAALADTAHSDHGPTLLLALGLREHTPLDMAVARAGLALFATRMAAPSAAAFRGFGARSWRALQTRLAEERLARAAEDDASAQLAVAVADGPDEPSEERREPWTPEDPEQVVALLEGSLRVGGRLLRRGHLLRQLSESTIVWRTARAGDDAPWRMLSIEGAVVARAKDVPPGTQPSAPRHADRDRVARGAAFDIAAYDRMRVLTTELRRLVADGRDLSVRLAARVQFDRVALARRLFWV